MKIELKVIDKEFFYEKDGLLKLDVAGKTLLPRYATDGSAGVDLYATKDYNILPQERVKIPTGIAIHIGSGASWLNIVDEDMGVMGVIVPRSGKGFDGLVLANLTGILDDDYQGEIIVGAWNNNRLVQNDPSLGDIRACPYERTGTINIKAGDRICQMIFVPVVKAKWHIVEEFTTKTERGDGGFGHSGR